jgi:hypothetical protein
LSVQSVGSKAFVTKILSAVVAPPTSQFVRVIRTTIGFAAHPRRNQYQSPAVLALYLNNACGNNRTLRGTAERTDQGPRFFSAQFSSNNVMPHRLIMLYETINKT